MRFWVGPRRILSTFFWAVFWLVSSAQVSAQDVALILVSEAPLDPQLAAAAQQLQHMAGELNFGFVADAALASGLARHGVHTQSHDAELAHATLREERHVLLDAVAFGRDAEVITRGTRLLTQVAAQLHTLSRDEEAAKAVFDSCLFVVRALLHRDDATALTQAQRCAQLVPDLSPSADVHPPEVMQLLARARENPSMLRIRDTAPLTEGCQVRAQGRVLGTVQDTMLLPAGTHDVQIDCGEQGSGWLHRVQMQLGKESELSVATELETKLSLTPGLRLRAPAASRLAPKQQLLLNEWLAVKELWSLGFASGQLHITRYPGASSVAHAPLTKAVAWSGSASDIDSLRVAVRELRCVDGCTNAEDLSRRKQQRQTRALALSGAGTLLLAWSLWTAHHVFDDRLGELRYDHPRYVRSLERQQQTGRASLGVTAVGALLVAASGVTLQRPAKRSTWLSWSLGALGAGMLSGAAVVWSRAGELSSTSCPDQERCLRARAVTPLATLLTSQGLGLLSFPIVQLIQSRRTVRSTVTASGVQCELTF